MNSPPAPKSVLELILEWSQADHRPAWQRDALRRIVASGKLEDTDIGELVLLCKKGRGDASISAVPVPFAEEHLPANPGAGKDIFLVAISDVTGVNQLAPQQTIPFEPNGLTIIYGDNGAGKSGYARILKRACRARHAGQIMPDAFDQEAVPGARATISYLPRGETIIPLAWEDAPSPHPILSAINVFDRDCATVHVREKNVVSFRPFGLDIPDDLADACQRVKDVLTNEQIAQQDARNAVFSKPTWKPSTRAGSILSNLKSDTRLDQLTLLASISDEERKRYQRLCEDLTKDPSVAAAEQALYAEQLCSLADGLRKVTTDTSDDRLKGIKSLSDDLRAKRSAATLAAANAFTGAPIEGVGGTVWRTLWDAARDFAEHVAYVGKEFPPDGDVVCVLCQQPLSEVAVARLKGFDAFIQDNTERQANVAELAFTEAAKKFVGEHIRVSTFTTIRQRIKLHDASLGGQILRFLASAQLRRLICVRACSSDASMELPAHAPSPIVSIVALEAATRAYAAELKQAADTEGRKLLEAERDDLADRIALEELLDVATTEVARLSALSLIGKCLTDTNTSAITRLGNDIADRVITPRMRDRFHDEIVNLAANRVRVEIVRAGGKFGSPHYQIRFLANATASVGNVLSEGEQTCIALAAFMTELATAAHNSALVFDDPVSSLDHRWRRKVAERLVAELGVRQVVVFTHDLVFLNDLKDTAEEQKMALTLVTLSRGPSGAGLVSSGLPWLASSIRSRVDAMEKESRAAKLLYDNHDEDGYRDAAFRIYSNLRNTWERAIEDVAFHGVINRHRDYVNTKNLRKSTVLTEADCDAFDVGFHKCCAQTDSHDSSRGRNAPPPSPAEMMNDVQAVLAWVKSLRERQKNVP